VVVTTCSRPAALERCLRTVLTSDYPAFEVIVVENRPRSAGTEAMLTKRFAHEPRLRYVEENRPGLSRARNRGLSCAEGEIVAFTDDDVIVDPAWIRRSAEAFETAEDVACVTGLILPLELETDSQLLLEQFAGLGKGFRRHTYRLGGTGDKHPLAVQMPGAIGSGANTALRADVATEIGGFDVSLGTGTPAAGGEDLDLYIRLLGDGHAIAYEPSAIVRHQHPDGTSRLHRQIYRYGVGLGAMVTRQFAGPEGRKLLQAVPAGVRHARDPASRKNAGKPDNYPRRLEWLERLGMFCGPVAYLLSALVSTTRDRAAPAKHPEQAAPASQEQAAPASEDGRRTIARPGNPALTAAALVACVAAPLGVLLGLPPVLRMPAVLALLCLAPGTALVASLRGRAELGLVVGGSLASAAVLAQTMLWLSIWWPTAYIYLVAAACGAPLLTRLSHTFKARTETGGFRPLRRAHSSLARTPKFVWGHIALLSAAMVAWALSLASADLSRIDGLGLVSAMPPTYFLAFAGLLIGFILALSRERVSRPLLGAYVLALILVLHGTTPVLYDEPRYQWVYNHFAVIDLIDHTGTVDRQVDIYNNWPGFFALNAVITRVTGVDPATYAPWAQVFFSLVSVAALRFALRGVTGSERLLWTATWLFLLGNWIGQDYLAPQAFGFVLSLVVLGLCLRCAPPPHLPRSRVAKWWDSVVVRRDTPVDEPPPPAPLSPRGALVIGALCYLAIVVSHQLTPVMLLAGVTGLAIFGRRVPLWVPAAMAVVEVWWVLLAWPYVDQHWSLLDLDPLANAAPAGYEPGEGMPGLTLVSGAARALTVLMTGLAAIGLFRRARAGHWDLAAASLMVTPLVVVGAQSYGGEGPYRLYLFALPWLSMFAAAACLPSSRSRRAHGKLAPVRRRVARQWRLALASGVSGVCLLFAYFGLEYINHLSARDVAAAEWFERHGPPDSLLVQATSNSISRVTYRYATTYDTAHTTTPALTDEPFYRHRVLTSLTLPRLEATLGSYGAPHTFLILTPGQEHFARLYGVLPSGWRPSLERALNTSSSFRPVYRHESSSIFEYLR
jgi:GT2 family glycosyltransferase